MELILVLAIVLVKILFIDLFKVSDIVRAFRVDAFMYDEVFAVFLVSQSVGTVGTF